MEAALLMSLGAAGVLSLILLRLAARHGWAWIQSPLEQHATDAESAFKHKVSAAVGDIDGRIKDVVHSELAGIESDIAALEAKVGGLA
jgi:hypothetical protein